MSNIRSRVTATCGAVLVLCIAARPQVTQRVSVSSSGTQGLNDSYVGYSISGDGRYVVFQSWAILVTGDTNSNPDCLVRDRLMGTTERVSVTSAGIEADSASYQGAISRDGRFVVFSSFASNLVPGDTNLSTDIFLRDRSTGTTERVSVDSAGVEGNGSSDSPSVSDDGRFVAFRSSATNLVSGDTNGVDDIFVRDRLLGSTECASVDPGGVVGNDQSGAGNRTSISSDGRFVAFDSAASSLVAGDTNAVNDVFVRDRQLGSTERVSLGTPAVQANGHSSSPTISGDGAWVAFTSSASNLVGGDSNGVGDVFLRDRAAGSTDRVSLGTGGVQGNSGSVFPAVSDDGRYVAFRSTASNLVPADTNGKADIFVRDRLLATTERVSVASGGAQANDESAPISFVTAISGDGRFVAFDSLATNLVAGDTNGFTDVFVRDRRAAGFSSLCDPGEGGVILCPCSNPPSGVGRGCDNSSGTGGAVLTASGAAYLSADSLVFATSGERPTALSILTQWTGTNPAGAIFGQGVRCTSGTFKRLYTKSAVSGSITAPDFGAGDLQVHVRAAALGDVLAAGQSRWHFVYYRDPMVLGGCPAVSTFNATQTGAVSWSP